MIAGPAHLAGTRVLATGTDCSARPTKSLTGIGTVADARSLETAEPTWLGWWSIVKGEGCASPRLKAAGPPPPSGAKKLNQYTGLSSAAPDNLEDVLRQGSYVIHGRAPP